MKGANLPPDDGDDGDFTLKQFGESDDALRTPRFVRGEPGERERRITVIERPEKPLGSNEIEIEIPSGSKRLRINDVPLATLVALKPSALWFMTGQRSSLELQAGKSSGILIQTVNKLFYHPTMPMGAWYPYWLRKWNEPRGARKHFVPMLGDYLFIQGGEDGSKPDIRTALPSTSGMLNFKRRGNGQFISITGREILVMAEGSGELEPTLRRTIPIGSVVQVKSEILIDNLQKRSALVRRDTNFRVVTYTGDCAVVVSVNPLLNVYAHVALEALRLVEKGDNAPVVMDNWKSQREIEEAKDEYMGRGVEQAFDNLMGSVKLTVEEEDRMKALKWQVEDEGQVLGKDRMNGVIVVEKCRI